MKQGASLATCRRATRSFARALAAVGCWASCLAVANVAHAGIAACPLPNVVVHASGRADASDACRGAQDAIDFLATQGLDLSRPIEIEVAARLPAVASLTAAGCYHEAQRRVTILTYQEFRKRQRWLGVPIDRAMYRSLAAHEVAHAVASCNFRIARPSIQAQEYIAYVTMLATMDSARRERVLSMYPGEGFEGDWQMTSTIYLLDPGRFGAQAYRHFNKPGNGRRYLEAVLAGKALVE